MSRWISVDFMKQVCFVFLPQSRLRPLDRRERPLLLFPPITQYVFYLFCSPSPTPLTITIYFIHNSGKLKLSIKAVFYINSQRRIKMHIFISIMQSHETHSANPDACAHPVNDSHSQDSLSRSD